MFWHLTERAKRLRSGAGVAAGPGLGTPPKTAYVKGWSKGQAREVPVEVLTPRKRGEPPSTLVISVERRGGRSVSVSIRGTTWGVLLALVLLATAAWLLTH